MIPRPRAFLVACCFLILCALALAGCGQILGLGSLHDRSEDGGETSEGGGDGTVSDTALPPDGAEEHVGTDSGADATDGMVEPDSRSDGEADAADAHADGAGDSGAECVIGGTSYASGAADPSNACQSCQPSVSASTWSDLTDGATCGSGGICRTGACVSGCEVGGVYYATNAPDPSNACQSCQPATSTSAWSAVTDGTGCASGKICSVGACTAGCYVGGSFYAPAAVNSANACQSCQPATSTTAWSSLTDGTSCASGKVCTAGACTAGCFIGGTFFTSTTPNPNNACQSCQPGTSTTAWSSVTDGTGCGNGQVCSSGACGTQCDIGGMIYASGTLNSTNSCQSCQPGVSTSAWSALANGTSCPGGDICNSAACTPGCFIGTTFYAPNASNSSNPCQTCQPSTSTSAWTTLTNGASCGTGVICDAGTCSSECLIGGVFYGAGTANASNSCQSCQPTTNTSGWSSVTNGTSCGTGGECVGGSCVCDSTSCPRGCCSGQSCVPWASQGAGTCGTNGAICGGCTNHLCDITSGTCSCDSNTCGGGCCNGGTSGNCVPFSLEGTGTCGMGGAMCAPCTHQTCVAPGTCSGQCAPTDSQTVACGNCGMDIETCNSSGNWQMNSCTGQGVCSAGPPPQMQTCNTYGSQTCTSGCSWGSCSCPPSPVCTPGAVQCMGSTPQSCDSCGQWIGATPCSSPTPVCVSGSCVTCNPGPPPQTQCTTNTTFETCQSNGSWGATQTNCSGSTPVCVSGACVGCTSGAQCMNGSCDTSTGVCTCDSNDCASGCCSGGANGSCMSPSASNCGINGSTCKSCSIANGTGTCSGGNCSYTCNSPPYTLCGSGSNSTCANLNTDPLNCGVCGKSCRGGTCSAGKCTAYVVASPPTTKTIASIAADSNYVSWTDTGLGAALSVPVAGGTAITLQSTASLYDIAMANGYVGFTSLNANGTNIWKDTDNNAGSTILWSVDPTYTPQPGFALSSGAEWWCAIDSHYARCCGFLSGGSCGQVYNGSLTSSRIAANATNFYWTDKVGGNIDTLPWTTTTIGTTMTKLVIGRASPDQIAADNAYAYWIEGTAVYRVPYLGPGASTISISSGPTFNSLASDGSNLYISYSSGGVSTILAIASNGTGGSTTISALGGENSTGLVYAGGALFWFDSIGNNIWSLVYP